MTTSLTQRLRRVAAVAALAAIGITGCGATSGSYDAPAVSDQDVAAPGEAATGAPGAGGSTTGSTGSSSSVSQQALVTTGTATLRAEDPITAAANFTDATVALGGLVAESETSASGDYPTATVTVRIPADKYQELVDRLGEFGEVQEQSSTSTDVGQRLTDLEARMEALQTSIDRLTQLMEGAATTADILEAEAMITERQAELDSLTAQLAYLQNQVSMSTLTVDFAPDAAATSHRVPNAFERGWRSFLDSTDGAIVFLMAVVPWIVILGIPIWLVTAALRRRRPATPAVQPLDY
ncbi:MAG TPA: DUF4349 domain-containing protein, partial [Actinomycetales bacterium]|nr:DUF4349 domain-containing protein [Actinomycetales bacterium]